jgi:proton-coupled amino acid transporter
MILITLLYVVVMGILYLKDGRQPEAKVRPIYGNGWATGFGFSIYSFEGIGIILPVQDVTKHPESYFRIVAAVILFVGFLYIFFGLYCTYVWQTDLSPIITD